jgi:hypothetical protein
MSCSPLDRHVLASRHDDISLPVAKRRPGKNFKHETYDFRWVAIGAIASNDLTYDFRVDLSNLVSEFKLFREFHLINPR